MKDQRSYFEKADFQSDLPNQLLLVAIGLFLVFLEVGLAQLPLFYGASPLLSVILIYYTRIFHIRFMPVGTVFLIGIVADLLLSDIIGAGHRPDFDGLCDRSTTLAARTIRVWRDLVRVFAMHRGDSNVPVHFLFNHKRENPSFEPILFQLGATSLLFPFGYLLIYSAHNLMQKLRVVS